MPTIPTWESPYHFEQTKPIKWTVRCRCGREAYPPGKTLAEAVKIARELGWDVDDNGAVIGCIHGR